MKVIFATSNRAKFEQAIQMAEGRKVEFVFKTIDFEELRDIDVESIVKSKALQAWNKFKKPVIVNDSGIFIDALNGFPGTQVNFALKTLGINNILRLLEGESDRKVTFKIAIAFADNGKVKMFYDEYPGVLTTEPRGDNNRGGWSDFLKLYIPEGYTKTTAELNDEEWKNYQQDFKKNDPLYKFLKWIDKYE